MIEKSPTGSIPASKRQDLSVLFLDIEGYTRLTEKLGGQEFTLLHPEDEIMALADEGWLITDDALKAAAELSSRYISDRYLPDKAIDVMDEAGARARISAMTYDPLA